MIGDPDSFDLGTFPTGRKLESANTPRGYVGDLRTLPEATGENIETALRFWEQADLDDFDRDGKIWVNRVTGERYRMAHATHYSRRSHAPPMSPRSSSSMTRSCSSATIASSRPSKTASRWGRYPDEQRAQVRQLV